MIYNKEASYPYPVLTNGSDNYLNGYFSLDIDLQENTNDYRFLIKYDVGSEFIKTLIEEDKAELIFVVQSKDNKFFNLNKVNNVVSISKTRISLSKRTSIQLLIKAKTGIDFKENNDLISFYDDLRDDLVVPSHYVLGLSNVVIFDGSNKKPCDLFEKKTDPTLKTDIGFELGEETIIIQYRNEEFQFSTYPNSTALNYPYIYMGLQKAIYKMIIENSDDNESLLINEMEPPTNGLSFKLYNLMRSKFVEEVNLGNVDEVISQISDKIIEKFTLAVKGISDNGN